MPLSINVGLSRKASKDYQSTGVSINVTAELDQSLLAKPDELQQQIGDLYAQAEAAMNRQAGNMAEPTQLRSRGNGGNGNDRNGTDRNDRSYADNSRRANGNGNSRGNGGGMTDSQRRAILAISQRRNLDVDYEAREIIGAEFDNLTIRQASELIDHLKGNQPTGDRNSR